VKSSYRLLPAVTCLDIQRRGRRASQHLAGISRYPVLFRLASCCCRLLYLSRHVVIQIDFLLSDTEANDSLQICYISRPRSGVGKTIEAKERHYYTRAYEGSNLVKDGARMTSQQFPSSSVACPSRRIVIGSLTPNTTNGSFPDMLSANLP